MEPDLWHLYTLMLRSRLFEEAVTEIWEAGLISGEMHLGTGEEAIVAAVVAQLEDGDAMALDHRGTPPLVMRGVDPLLLLREFLGQPDGLNAGQGGHMHLFAPEYLAASSGIVGAAGPAAAGFALAAQQLRPGSVAVAFFGEGATNQGMLLESFNLAVAWHLPVLFVCKDDGWAITTPSASTITGSLVDRARGFGMAAAEVDGLDASASWHAVHAAVLRARAGEGPTFLHMHCVHPEGHFLGYQFFRLLRRPLREGGPVLAETLKSLLSSTGVQLRERLRSAGDMVDRGQRSFRAQRAARNDPLQRLRSQLLATTVGQTRLETIESETTTEIARAVETALATLGTST
jgi:acetoin:2,6-dichlorophenolindophenol oxidoreductase subunit alpha